MFTKSSFGCNSKKTPQILLERAGISNKPKNTDMVSFHITFVKNSIKMILIGLV